MARHWQQQTQHAVCARSDAAVLHPDPQEPFKLPVGTDCGLAFVQLQPVMPQLAVDVRAGETFFVLDVSGGWAREARGR